MRAALEIGTVTGMDMVHTLAKGMVLKVALGILDLPMESK